MKKRIIILFCLVNCAFNLLSQQDIKALGIGDLVPNLKSKNVLFSKTPSIELKQFPGKLIILDFFQTTCLSCVKKLPLYMSLQQKFKKEIQIILVTPENNEEVLLFWQERVFLKNVQLPIVTEDSQWVKYFPHEAISHEAWIGTDQKVKAFTGEEYVKEEYILEALHSDVLNWRMKMDYSYDISQPVFTYNREQPEIIKPTQMFYSCLWRKRERSQGGLFMLKDSINKTFKLSIINSYGLNLYKMAIGWQLRDDTWNRIIWETKRREEIDPSVSNLSNIEWHRRYNLSFEAVFPISTPGRTKSAALLNSVNTYFGINARLETRNVDCWLLVARPGYSYQKLTKEEVRSFSSQNTNKRDSTALLKPSFVASLMDDRSQVPVIDGTNLDDHIFIGIVARKDLGDIEKMKEHLLRNGFDLVKSRQPLELFVLSDWDAK